MLRVITLTEERAPRRDNRLASQRTYGRTKRSVSFAPYRRPILPGGRFDLLPDFESLAAADAEEDAAPPLSAVFGGRPLPGPGVDYN